jgi:hypothetical protein
VCFFALAQQTADAAATVSKKIHYHDAFAPFFYYQIIEQPTRSASDQPGAEYWQKSGRLRAHSKN